MPLLFIVFWKYQYLCVLRLIFNQFHCLNISKPKASVCLRLLRYYSRICRYWLYHHVIQRNEMSHIHFLPLAWSPLAAWSLPSLLRRSALLAGETKVNPLMVLAVKAVPLLVVWVEYEFPAAAFFKALADLWWDLWAMRMLYSLLNDFPDLEAALVTLRPNPCSWVNPWAEALWNPVKLSGSVENWFPLDFEPFGLLTKEELDLVNIHKTSPGCLICLKIRNKNEWWYLSILTYTLS